MTPIPQKHTTEPILQDDSIVISGISGMYPKANNIKEFADKLYNMARRITPMYNRHVRLSWKAYHWIKGPLDKGRRLVVTHVGSEECFVDDGLLIFEAKKELDNYHKEMNSDIYEKWLKHILPKLKDNAVPESVISDAHSRWVFKHLEVHTSQFVGIAPNLNHFDAQFFMTHYNTAKNLDPMVRKLLEHSYQSIYDAGLSPEHLNGKKIGVFIGTAFTDSEKENLINRKIDYGMGLLGCNKTMFANRISYWLNIKGPSMNIDDGNASSAVALELACAAIRRGDCEAAFVGGANLCLHPYALVHYARLGMIAQDGKTKCFCENADGSVLSDVVQVLFLQKAKDALRNYGQVVHIKNVFIPITGDKIGPQDGHYCNAETTAKFIKEFYDEVQIPPQAVEYVEGQSLGLPQSDKCELKAIAKVYCKDRQDTLLVGSVTSNIGLTLAAGGIVGMTKVLLSYHQGVIAANMNCERLRKDVAALENGKMRIVTEHQPFRRTYAAVHSTSILGVNTHILLRGCYKPKNQSRPEKTSLPYLVALSGRQEANVQYILHNLKSRPIDAEEIALLHNIHSKNISGHLGRGYIILDTDAEKNRTIGCVDKVVYFNNAKRPLWFVYSGMGSQWAGMGAQLMRIPIFSAAIERCRQVLAPKGLDIVEIICSPQKTMFDNILYSFVGIAAIQIGLTDVLRHVGLTPDGVIGHSLGELGCAYADGALTVEEMILASYYRGQVSLETPMIRGSMAAVGLGYKQISAICPAEVDVACHNSSQSCTISGPIDVIRNFIAELADKGIYTKEVPCSNIAYHSRYVAGTGPKLLKYLKKVIKNPKLRSYRWISTSVPQDEWHVPSAKYCSAEYYTNNLLKPVLFEEMCGLIPHNAALVEIAPHGLLQAILKRSMPKDCQYFPLTRRGHSDNVVHLLDAIGKIYMEGYALNLQVLYPPIQFPVSTETPMLSHMVQWMHDEKWPVTQFNSLNKITAAICKFVKSIHDNEFKYLQGHLVLNKMCYPFAAALVDVWDMFAMHANLPKRGASIMFQDVQLHAQPMLFDQKPLRINVSMHKGTTRFEVRSEYSKVISGIIIQTEPPVTNNDIHLLHANGDYESTQFTSKDVYQMLNERGYNYSGDFRSIECVCASLNKAALAWSGNWVTFIDGLLQLNVLRQAPDVISLPTFIKKICINVEEHQNNHMYHLNGREVMQANIAHERTRCGGVVLEYIQYKSFTSVSRGLHRLELNVTAFETANLREIKQHEEISKFIKLQCGQIGKLESLHWVHSSFKQKSEGTVTVYFAGLNLIDLKRASGIVSCDKNMYGMDYSGVTNSGERVMGIVSSGAASSHVDPEPLLMWPVPEHWSLEDAATVPLAYAYAFYALVIKGNLSTGMSILIHEGAEAVGQAAVAIAIAYDCRVFVTVSDRRQKMFLQKRFPQLQGLLHIERCKGSQKLIVTSMTAMAQLGELSERNIESLGFMSRLWQSLLILEEHIVIVRDISFVDDILTATSGRGCDIVLSCLKIVFKDASLNCISSFGLLIDTVQIEDHEDYEYGMSQMTRGRAYLLMDFSSIFTCNKFEDMKDLQKMVSDGISAGYVVPLPRITYVPRDVQRAFKLLQKRQLFGRVLLRMCDNMINIKHRIICDADKCQVVYWDDEVLAVQLIQTLIRQGAKKICICCTTLSSYQLFKIRSWENLGVKLAIYCDKLTKDLFWTEVLNNALSLGSIEGIYIVITTAANNETFTDFASAFDKLDLMSRLLCYQLKHLIIISTKKDLGEKMYLSRIKSGHTATWVDLSNLTNISEMTGLDLADTIESAQCNTNASLIAQIKQMEQLSLFDQVISLADVNVTPNMGMDISLQQLGMEVENISSICAFLNIMYNLSLNESEIPHLTLQKLRELESYVTDLKPANVTGLSIFVSDVHPDELLATKDLVELSTLSHIITSVESDNDISKQYLYIVPGIEGHHERFRLLCERLKIPALVLQPGLDHPHETAQETAQRYFKTLSKYSLIADKFYILAYESGVMDALELAAILEDQGSTGTIFCLGYAPTEFHAEIEYLLSDYEADEQLQNAVVRHIYELIIGEDTTELAAELQAASSWARKVDACARRLAGRTTHSAQYTRALLEVMLARLQRARRAVAPAHALRSKLVVLRAASARSAPQHDAELQRLSRQPVAVHHLQLPLSCVVKDMQCAALINQYLDDDVLQEFETKNICECYPVTVY